MSSPMPAFPVLCLARPIWHCPVQQIHAAARRGRRAGRRRGRGPRGRRGGGAHDVDIERLAQLFEQAQWIPWTLDRNRARLRAEPYVIQLHVNNPKRSAPTLNETFLGLLYPTENYKVYWTLHRVTEDQKLFYHLSHS